MVRERYARLRYIGRTQRIDASPTWRRWMERAAKKLRMRAWRLLLLGVRNSGAAFIKWGQWSATREDLFPQVSAHLTKT